MVESVLEECRRGVLSYPTVPREQWVLEWPGQVVLVVTAIFWTRVRLVDESCVARAREMQGQGDAGQGEAQTAIQMGTMTEGDDILA